MIVKNKSARIWKEVIVTLFKVLSLQFPGESEETHQNPYSG
jgi:hypothetical protein